MRFSQAKISDLSSDLLDILKVNSSEREGKIYFEKGVFLYGATGTGKTHALYAIKNDFGGHLVNFVDFLVQVKDGFSSQQFTLSGHIQGICERGNILIDDLGAEKSTEWVHEIVYLIVNKAYINNIPLFISTNLSLEQFTEKYGERIVSRLADICVFYEMKGEDRRLTQ